MLKFSEIGQALIEKSVPAPSLHPLIPFILHASEGLSSRDIAAELKIHKQPLSHTTIAKLIKRYAASYQGKKRFWHELEGLIKISEPIADSLELPLADFLHVDNADLNELTNYRDVNATAKKHKEAYLSFIHRLHELKIAGDVMAIWLEISGQNPAKDTVVP